MKHFPIYLGSLCLILMLSACATQTTPPTTTTPSTGRVVMTFTDAAANMGTISSVAMTIDKVELHSDAGGWITVATPQRTYDLLAIKASQSNVLLADVTLPPGRFDQMRLTVTNVMVQDAKGFTEAKMPSNALRMNGEIVVLAGKTATVSFDFIADQSLHMTGNGKYIFAPVIALESRTDASADVSASDRVMLSGGTLQTSSRVGMDTVGNLVIGGTLPPYVQINADGTISGTQNPLQNNTSMT